MQLGRLAAAVVEPDPLEPDELPRPVEVEPEAPPVPLVPAVPAEPSVVDPLEPEPEPLPALVPAEPLPELVPAVPLPIPLVLEPEPELFIALFSCTLPCASRQCVAADTFAELEAADEPLLEPDCAEAAKAPHASKADASSVVLKTFISFSLAPRLEYAAGPTVPGTFKF